MKLLTQPGPLCTIYSTAMLLDEEPEAILKELGHEKNIHIQEIVDLCLRRNKALVCIELHPLIGDDNGNWSTIHKWDDAIARFNSLIAGRPGLAFGRTSSGNMHACAWDGSHLYDPRGSILDINTPVFAIQECWLAFNTTATTDSTNQGQGIIAIKSDSTGQK